MILAQRISGADSCLGSPEVISVYTQLHTCNEPNVSQTYTSITSASYPNCFLPPPSCTKSSGLTKTLTSPPWQTPISLMLTLRYTFPESSVSTVAARMLEYSMRNAEQSKLVSDPDSDCASQTHPSCVTRQVQT